MKTLLIVLGLIAAAVGGYYAGVYDFRHNIAPGLLEHVQATADEPLQPDYTCTWSETENGFRQVCGPRHVEPTGDECTDQGLVKICVRRYGKRTCDCYPE